MVKKSKILRFGGSVMVAAAIVCYSLGGAAYAYQSNELRVTNHVFTGDIDITITETQIAEDGITVEPFENGQIVVPGDTVSKIVSVQNLANDCYIRVKVGYNQPVSQSEEPVDGSQQEMEKPDIAQIVMEVSDGRYMAGDDIAEGTYKIVAGQDVEFTVTLQLLEKEYVKQQMKAYMMPYLEDGSIEQHEKVIVENVIREFERELERCSMEGEIAVLLERYVPIITNSLPESYHNLLSSVDFSKELIKKYTGEENTVVLRTGQILEVPKGNAVKLVHLAENVFHELTDLSLNGISDDWVKAGDGYYYYKNILETGEIVRFFEFVTFPSVWTEEFSGFTCGLDILAEAVQSDNFTPQFWGEEPWGDTEIELCIHENDGTVISKGKTYTTMEVSLSAQATQLITNAEDFFQNMDELMPGDTVSDILYIRNDNAHEAEIFFHTETPEGLTEEQLDLLHNLQLSVSVNGAIVYEGNLESEQLNEKISLGTYHTGEEGTVVFCIHMPKEDKNIYALRDTKITWIFDCGWDDPDSFEAPQTGIEENLVRDMFLAGCLFLTGGMILVLAGNKKDKIAKKK